MTSTARRNEYTTAVGRKFHEDGRVRTFAGNTIICFVAPESSTFELAGQTQRQIRALPFAHKFAFLPPSSFHMTVMELLCDQARMQERWTSELPLDASLDALDEFFIKTALDVPPPAAIRMQFVQSNRETCSLILEPADAETADALRTYRNAVSQATSVRFPDHDTYQFHISLAYRLIELTDGEEATLGRTLDEIDLHLHQHFGLFEPAAPQLTFFDDMFRFVTADQRDMLHTR